MIYSFHPDAKLELNASVDYIENLTIGKREKYNRTEKLIIFLNGKIIAHHNRCLKIYR
jgi:hypothetical protein